MVSVIQANIFTVFSSSTEPCFLLHQANCFHTMGAGIAKDVRIKYPAAYAVDRETAYGSEAKLGKVSFAIVSQTPPKAVINVYGQHRYGRTGTFTEYPALKSGYANVLALANAWKASGLTAPTILLPYRMGCNLAGGDWSIVQKLIEDAFASYEGKVQICQL